LHHGSIESTRLQLGVYSIVQSEQRHLVSDDDDDDDWRTTWN